MSETGENDALDLLGRMHLDAIRNGDWGGAARLAEVIETRIRAGAVDVPPTPDPDPTVPKPPESD